ncbi:MAG: hypothetical protein FWD47_05235 [Treponema sp.]|nr:hypothetical protein [Treponema sp.]
MKFNRLLVLTAIFAVFAVITVSAQAPASGTYTFNPRPQASMGGMPQEIYIDRIVVHGNFMNIFLSNRAVGPSTGHGGVPYFMSNSYIQDASLPQRTYAPVREAEQREGQAVLWVVTFENVQSTSFSLVNTSRNPNLTFEGIVLNQPEAGSQPVPSNAVIPSGPIVNGTYSFFPRPQALQGGMPQGVYIDRIVVHGNFMNIFLSNRETGPSTGHSGVPYYMNNSFIQDLDRPQVTYRPVREAEHREGQAVFWVITFENVQSRRFALSNTSRNPNFVFEEIIIGNPD